MSQKTKFDVVVVGAGVAGSVAALVAARAGLSVALIERGEYPGAKNVSGGALYNTEFLHKLIPNFWEEAPVERHLTRRMITIMSPESALTIDYKTANFAKPPYNGFTVLRPKFDRWLASKAEEAGALLITSTVVDDLIFESPSGADSATPTKRRVVGIKTRRDEGDIYADVIIACDGVNSFLAKKAGLQREFKAEELTLGVKEVIALDRKTLEDRFQLEGREGMTNEYVGHASGLVFGGGFLYTNWDSLSIGVVTQIQDLAEKKVKAYDLLAEFKRHPSIAPLVKGGTVKEYSGHMIPEAGIKMMPKLYSDGMLVAGDAAGFVFATGLFLEGMNYAMASGAAAANAVILAHKVGDFSAQQLAVYQRNLEQDFVLKDMKSFKHAPEFVNNPRLQNVYPDMICQIAEDLFRSNGRPKKKVLPIIWKEFRKSKTSLRTVIKDAYEGGRSLLW
jgi:electron transfer flavoprotein-quinone oxidoreductase